MGKIVVYVGTYSEVLGHVPHGKGRGIELFEYDTESGSLTPLSIQDQGASFISIWNSTWLTLHPSKPFLFAAEETDKANGCGSVVAFRIEANGKLVFINKVSTVGAFPCHLSVDASGKILAAANYGSGNVPLYSIKETGELEYLNVTQHQGKGPNAQRQEAAHAHQSLFKGDNLYVVDLGIDSVVQYKLQDKKIVHNPAGEKVTFAPGAGPRHVDFHPTEPVAFVAHELNSTISVCSVDNNGTLKITETKSTLPAGFTGESYPSEIAVSKNGKFVYVANRGPDHIAVFKYSSAPHVFEAIAHVSTEGAHPRHFTLSPDGRFLLVGNQNSDTIVIFQVDETSGLLTKRHVINVGTPACIVFLQH
eukprot:Phypoly_transcript_10723.p1 GENE.Phypoly_transcript_10723~~Phypoly_transcript_10723.p1  ORF type:complete len:363 (+),score=55.34 Phypoly_transcript_10723:156-1244(+)